ASYSDNTYSPVDEKYYMLPKLHQTEEFKKYPCFTKDDFFETLLNLGFERSQAFQIATAIWRGQANSNKEQHINFFNSLNLPDDFMKIAKAYLYLWDRSSCARIIFTFAKLAYYSNIDSRLFGQTVHK
ncbi:MAG: hypothetical protein Q4A54_11790, partial [Parabacteroides sp.]|nr:hypothetical protein [Parabacteroides sp.]